MVNVKLPITIAANAPTLHLSYEVHRRSEEPNTSV